MSQERISYLLDRYRSGRLTQEEAAELLKLSSTAEGADVTDAIRELLEKSAEASAELVDQALAGSTLEKVLAIDKTDLPITRKYVPRRIKRGAARMQSFPLWHPTWLRYAAAIVLLLGAAAFVFFGRTHRETTPPGQSLANAQVVSPGKQGAVLLLSNGSTIVLDSLDNGIIAQQEGASIRLDGGRLAYDYDRSAVKGDTAVYNTMVTPNGRQFQLVLPDGSKVWLNAASSLRFPTFFTGDARVVEMTGEAYFEVASLSRPQTSGGKEGKVPFIVKFNTPSGTVGEIKVLGTHFNVNAYKDDNSIKATLLEGSVIVHAGESSQMLNPGEQANIGRSRDITLHKDVNLEEVMAWKNGFFYFIDAGLETVMQQLGRWYDMEIVYEGEIPSRRFEGKIQQDLNLSDVLDLLSKSGMIQFRVEGKKIVVFSKDK